MTIGQIILVLILWVIADLIANKVFGWYTSRKAKKLYNNIACQVKNLDINKSTKGD